jgi:hypothetical protein
MNVWQTGSATNVKWAATNANGGVATNADRGATNADGRCNGCNDSAMNMNGNECTAIRGVRVVPQGAACRSLDKQSGSGREC